MKEMRVGSAIYKSRGGLFLPQICRSRFHRQAVCSSRAKGKRKKIGVPCTCPAARPSEEGLSLVSIRTDTYFPVTNQSQRTTRDNGLRD